MVKEVLDTMVDLAGEGMTMLVVTHERDLPGSRQPYRIHGAGQIIEANTPSEFFATPNTPQTKLFLSQILCSFSWVLPGAARIGRRGGRVPG